MDPDIKTGNLWNWSCIMRPTAYPNPNVYSRLYSTHVKCIFPTDSSLEIPQAHFLIIKLKSQLVIVAERVNYCETQIYCGSSRSGWASLTGLATRWALMTRSRGVCVCLYVVFYSTQTRAHPDRDPLRHLITGDLQQNMSITQLLKYRFARLDCIERTHTEQFV